MSSKNFALLFGFMLMGFSCTKQTSEVVSEPEPQPQEALVGYPNVEEALWVYFERFEEEGQARGYDIDLRSADITGMIETISDDGVAGTCSYSSFAPNHVTIDLAFWDQASDRVREFVVFHELGHCDLARAHREDANSNGLCLSIMRSGLGDCRDAYNSINRDDYLDELFDPQYRNTIGRQPQ